MSIQPAKTLSQFRMSTWEEDISAGHRAERPFENSIAPSQMQFDDFNVASLLTPELLDGVLLDEFIARDTFPIPSTQDREGYNTNQDASYFLNGLADYLKINQIVQKYQVRMDSYFDFGCASGRVIRHFCAQSKVPELWASDVNGRHVKWLNEFLPARLKVIHNHAVPNLQIADHSIDVISAFSVFTHIDTFETAWLAELYRILRPDGLVYLTVQNDDSWNFLRGEGVSPTLKEHMRKRIVNFDELIQSDLPDDRLDFRHTDLGPYRALVFHSNRYLNRTWGRFFEIAEIIPCHHGSHQSVLVGRKRTS